MNHDELLKRIIIVGDTSIEEALRAVVELHKPDLVQGDISCCTHRCQYFEEDGFGGSWHLYPYPCPTIQAIEKELK